MARVDQSTARAHRDWLQAVIEQTGIAPTTLAKRINISPSTLTRYLRSASGTLHATTIAKISAYTNIPPPGSVWPAHRQLPMIRSDVDRHTPRGAPVDEAVACFIAAVDNAEAWHLQSRALELAGYLPGDILIFDTIATPLRGDIVRAELLLDHGSHVTQIIVRVFDQVGATSILAPATLDPAGQAMTALDDRVRLNGVLIGMVRPRRIRA